MWGWATSKPVGLAVDILEYFGLAREFDRIIGEDGSEKQLGKPELIRRRCRISTAMRPWWATAGLICLARRPTVSTAWA